MQRIETHHSVPPLDRPAAQPGPYLPTAESARHIGVSISTLWRYLRNDPTFPQPFRYSTTKTMFSVPELDAWVETKRAPHAQPTT